MSIKWILMAILATTLSGHAAAPLRGADRLRELVLFPEMNINFGLDLVFQGDAWEVQDTFHPPDIIDEAREVLKKQPNDVKQLLRLGFSLERAGQTNESRDCYQEVVQLCQTRLEAEPFNGLNLRDYGFVLSRLNETGKAESMFRRAVLVSSNDWRCWAGLGTFLGKRFNLTIYDDYHNGLPPTAGTEAIQNYRPPAKTVARLKALDNEARECFEKVTALATNDPDAFVQRAGFEAATSYDRNLLDHVLNDRKLDLLLSLSDGLTSPGAITNLHRAAELTSENCSYLEIAVFSKVLLAMPRDGLMDTKTGKIEGCNFKPGTWPEETHQYIREIQTRLETISQSPDSKLAAIAMESLGFNYMLLGNSEASVAALRRAVALDPTCDAAWDLLVGSLVKSASTEDLAAVCQQRLTYKDSARNHLYLARVYLHQQKWDKVGEQAEAALKIEPDNYVAHMDLMALTLKQINDTNYLSAFREQYDTLTKLAQDPKNAAINATCWRVCALDTAIADGLVASPEYKAAAKDCVDRVLKYYPNDTQAKEILDALN
jgi:tetratricopeptide (TPR) repeat protein